MGSIPLLTRNEELFLAKEMERGDKIVIKALRRFADAAPRSAGISSIISLSPHQMEENHNFIKHRLA